jgi:hypothetical protein
MLRVIKEANPSTVGNPACPPDVAQASQPALATIDRCVPLAAKAFQSQDTVAIARNLLGKYLVRSTESGVVARMITEVEAYDGERDRACHARNGRTPRNAVMYEPGGLWYVYLW